MSEPLLTVQDLTIAFRSRRGPLPVVSEVSLTLEAGGSIGLVGESGCGKSTLAGALLGFLRFGADRLDGRVCVDGADVFQLSERELRPLRGGKVALVPQNAGHALTPTMRVGTQLDETLRRHRTLTASERRAESERLFDRVGLPGGARLLDRYPHELSGGQQQRVALAIALSGEPRLLVLDEPTTGLDVVTQARVLTLLETLRHELGIAMVYVSHDLGVISRVCDRFAVMYAGRIVETGPTATVFASPAHPYTRGLVAAMPLLDRPGMPEGMAGSPPLPGAAEAGCPFAPRCPLVLELCRTDRPPLESIQAPERLVACHRAAESQALLPAPAAGLAAREPGVEPLLRLSDIDVDYELRGLDGVVARWRRRLRHEAPPAPTVEGVSFDVNRGETLALVGESGSGKTTLAWVIAGLRRQRAGTLILGEDDIGQLIGHRAAPLRRRIQLVFQNPDTSLNPRQSIRRVIERPLQLFGAAGRRERSGRIDELLREVGLDETHASRYPGQLSGGQRQRVGIARALAADPELVLCDEVVSALDVSVQASILGLLDRLRREHDVAYLFVSHDLAVVRSLADRVAVLYSGRLCEIGPVEDVYAGPSHPYTRVLLAAARGDDPPTPGRPAMPATEQDDGVPVAGCVFQRQCPRYIGSVCDEETPPWRTTASGHRLRCHHELDELDGDRVDDRVVGAGRR